MARIHSVQGCWRILPRTIHTNAALWRRWPPARGRRDAEACYPSPEEETGAKVHSDLVGSRLAGQKQKLLPRRKAVTGVINPLLRVVYKADSIAYGGRIT